MLSLEYNLAKHEDNPELLPFCYELSFYMSIFKALESWNDLYYFNKYAISLPLIEMEERMVLERRFFVFEEMISRGSLRKVLSFYSEEMDKRKAIITEAEVKSTWLYNSFEQYASRILLTGEFIVEYSVIARVLYDKYNKNLMLHYIDMTSALSRQYLRDKAFDSLTKTYQAPKDHNDNNGDDDDDDDGGEVAYHDTKSDTKSDITSILKTERCRSKLLRDLSEFVELKTWEVSIGIGVRLKKKNSEDHVTFYLHDQHGHQGSVQNCVRNIIVRALRVGGWIE